MKITLLMISVFGTMFLVGLDRTIISTAIPQITDDFNSLDDVGWYGSAYNLTCCAFQLLFGKIYVLYDVKTAMLLSTLLFEVASAICGAAPNSVAFIIGRAIAGVGAAGIFAGTIVCIVFVVPLHRRPQIQGLFGALFGIASIVGPLVGGAFTSNVTWRWCFYINLPLGGVAMVIMFFFLDIPERDTTKVSWNKKLPQLDALGTTCIIPGVTCLLLALQWGGQTYAWNNGKIIALLTLMGALLVGFVLVQVFIPSTATIPPRVFKFRSVVSATWASVCLGAGNYIYVYFIPIWFQSIKGTTAVQSGIRLLPTMLSTVVASMLSGAVTPKIGYYTPLAIIGTCLMSIGAGLITTWHVDTSAGKWIGYQILYGFGLGMCFQTPNLAVQTVMPKKDVPIGLALMLFTNLLASAVFISVGENVLSSQLVLRLSGIPGFNASQVVSSGLTSLLESIPVNLRDEVLVRYNEALMQVFQVGLIVTCLTILGTATLEWKSVLKEKKAKEQAQAQAQACAEAEAKEKAAAETSGAIEEQPVRYEENVVESST
ncbi:putative MFS aflatoxin efflux pump [Talaromyces proteolyticus]|uniref:MFS aflatoxin efflux pump n=1 Tax=Talaromyces proteolyticus TaxID=1131652 RepID=A0AAD4L2H9_9EURO|nr:putative MFS aflatoxin efflux pump [Talaromyces proteolyticus]KAH8703359.1 putative MFS aflatoxin efflux pump [Talaromyces proteolyticus]